MKKQSPPVKSLKIISLFDSDLSRISKTIFFFSLFVILYFLLFSVRIPLDYGDDVAFVKASVSFEWLMQRYKGWTSRIILDAITVTLCHHPFLFRFLCALCLFSLPLLVRMVILDICGKDRTEAILPHYFIFSIFFLFPLKTFHSAGFITTICNYLFPLYLVFASYVMLSKLKGFGLKDICLATIATLALIIAANQELLAALMFQSSILCLIFNFKRKGAILFLIVASLSLYFTITCDGNGIRFLKELRWIEDYSDWNTPYKIYMGIITTVHYYLFCRNTICVFVVMTMLMCTTGKLKVSILGGIVMLIFQIIVHIWIGRGDTYFLGKNFSFSISGTIGTFWTALFIIFMIYLFYKLEIKRSIKIFLGLMVACAVCDRVLMGFSPTIFASSTRTFLFTDHALVLYVIVISILSNKISRRDFSCILLTSLILQFALQGGKIYKLLIGSW